MARLARVVAAGVPHHVTQRGNRRQHTFFTDDDYRLYRALMAEWCMRSGVEIWAYCLMPNHVHLNATPETAEGWPWCSARAHLAGGDDDLVTAAALLAVVGDWRAFLSLPPDEDEVDILRRHQRTGRPLGDDAFVERLEASLGRNLRPRKPGPKPLKMPRKPRDQ